MDPFDALDERSRDIFRRLVETYLDTGEPVGSRTLSHDASVGVSAATVRNVMADLTELGLLHAPHVSAGRLPTERGLRLFVDSLMQVGDLSDEDRRAIEAEGRDERVEAALEAAAEKLSGLTRTASLVLSPKADAPLRQIEFVATGAGSTLAILVFEDGRVENRLIEADGPLSESALAEATNFVNARLKGRTLAQARAELSQQIDGARAELDALSARLIKEGVADAAHGEDVSLIVRGRGHLIDDAAMRDIERVRMLFDDLEKKRDVARLVAAARDGSGVKVFIGSENRLFSLSGSSVIAAPYHDEQRKVVGVLGVIGPTRINYAKVIPIVDYTAEMVSRMLK